MFKKQVFLAIAAALVLGAHASAAPLNLTELANYLRANLTGGSNNVQSVDYTGSGGVTFNNTYDANGLVAGSHFISVGAVPITQLVTNGSGNQLPTGNGAVANGNVVQIFALQGTITNVAAGVVTVRFDAGVTRLYQSNQQFNTANLTTWGFPGTVSAINATAVDDKVLKPQEALLTGNPNAYGSNGATGNPLSVNQVSTPVNFGASISGTAIFQQGTGVDIWGPRTNTGTPSGFTLDRNGMVSDFTDVFQLSSNTNFDLATTPGNLAIANAIVAAFGTEAAGLLLNGGVFAPAQGVAGNANYNPNLTAAGTTTGDFSSQTAATLAPTIEVLDVPGVPEPASMAAWGLIMAGVGAYRVIRRRRKNVA